MKFEENHFQFLSQLPYTPCDFPPYSTVTRCVVDKSFQPDICSEYKIYYQITMSNSFMSLNITDLLRRDAKRKAVATYYLNVCNYTVKEAWLLK